MASEYRAIAVPRAPRARAPGSGAGHDLQLGARPRMTVIQAHGRVFDAHRGPLRDLNQRLHDLAGARAQHLLVRNPSGAHAVACGIDAEVEVEIDGHVGYYCAGMNQGAAVRIHGNAGVSLAENIMSGSSSSTGARASRPARRHTAACWSSTATPPRAAASRSRAATSSSAARSATCRASWPRPDASSCSATRATRSATRSTRRALCVRGGVASVGADCVEKELRDEHRDELARLLEQSGMQDASPGAFRRYGSARQLYNFHVDNAYPVPEAGWHPGLRESYLFDRNAIAEIQRAAREGIYDIRGFGAKRRLPHFDDLLLLGASVSRCPLEGVPRALRHRRRAWHSFREPPAPEDPDHDRGRIVRGALGTRPRRRSDGARARSASTTTGDGGTAPEGAAALRPARLPAPAVPLRDANRDDLRRCDAIEIVVGQGAKPGGGGMLLGQKISDRVAEMRDLPQGIDQRSACRHPDWTGPDDLEIKIKELREITDWEKPVFVKIGATRTYYDVSWRSRPAPT